MSAGREEAGEVGGGLGQLLVPLVATALALVAGLAVELGLTDAQRLGRGSSFVPGHGDLGSVLGVERPLAALVALAAGLVSGAALTSGVGRRRLRALAEAGWVLAAALLGALLLGAWSETARTGRWLHWHVEASRGSDLILSLRAIALLASVAVLGQAAGGRLRRPRSRRFALALTALGAVVVAGPGLVDALDLYRPRSVPPFQVSIEGAHGAAVVLSEDEVRRVERVVTIGQVIGRSDAVRIDLRGEVELPRGQLVAHLPLAGGGSATTVAALDPRGRLLIQLPEEGTPELLEAVKPE